MLAPVIQRSLSTSARPSAHALHLAAWLTAAPQCWICPRLTPWPRCSESTRLRSSARCPPTSQPPSPGARPAAMRGAALSAVLTWQQTGAMAGTDPAETVVTLVPVALSSMSRCASPSCMRMLAQQLTQRLMPASLEWHGCGSAGHRASRLGAEHPAVRRAGVDAGHGVARGLRGSRLLHILIDALSKTAPA